MHVEMETFFLVNALCDAALCMFTVFLRGLPFSFPRLILCALLGGSYACLYCFVPLLKDSKGMFLFILALVLCPYRRQPFKTYLNRLISAFLVLWVCAFFLCGLGMAFSSFLGKLSFSFFTCLTLLLGGCVLLLFFAPRTYPWKRAPLRKELRLHFQKGTVLVTALIDTGAWIREPLSGKSVLLVEEGMLNEVLKGETIYRYVYFKTALGESYLPVYKPLRVAMLDGTELPIYVAPLQSALSQDGDYQAILPSCVLDP